MIEMIFGLMMWVAAAMNIPTEKLPQTQIGTVPTEILQKIEKTGRAVCGSNICWGDNTILLDQNVDWTANNVMTKAILVHIIVHYFQYHVTHKKDVKKFQEDKEKENQAENIVERWLAKQNEIKI
jgi:hypothetical protein